MEEDINDFIDNRINRNYHILTKDKNWKSTYTKFNDLYANLNSTLSENQKKQLDEIINLKDLITGYESTFAYKLGSKDTIKLLKI